MAPEMLLKPRSSATAFAALGIFSARSLKSDALWHVHGFSTKAKRRACLGARGLRGPDQGPELLRPGSDLVRHQRCTFSRRP